MYSSRMAWKEGFSLSLTAPRSFSQLTITLTKRPSNNCRSAATLLLKILPSPEVKPHHNITVSWDGGAEPTEENLYCKEGKGFQSIGMAERKQRDVPRC